MSLKYLRRINGTWECEFAESESKLNKEGKNGRNRNTKY